MLGRAFASVEEHHAVNLATRQRELVEDGDSRGHHALADRGDSIVRTQVFVSEWAVTRYATLARLLPADETVWAMETPPELSGKGMAALAQDSPGGRPASEKHAGGGGHQVGRFLGEATGGKPSSAANIRDSR
ncbi:hypothetical protein [Streptomyces sp. NPDC001415]